MQNKQEIINECFVLISAYFMLIFSDWIDNTAELQGFGNLKSAVGRVMLIVLLICVVVNITIVVREVSVGLKAKFRSKKIIKMKLDLMEYRNKKQQKQL